MTSPWEFLMTQNDSDKQTGLTIQQVINDATSSTWIKTSLIAALHRDPVDAANDADILAHLLSKRCLEYLSTHPLEKYAPPETKTFIPPQEWGEQRQ